MLPSITPVIVPKQDLYKAFVTQTCQQLNTFNSRHIVLTIEFAKFIYESVELGVRQFGKSVNQVLISVTNEMNASGKPITFATFKSYYYTMRFLIDLKFEDKILFDKLIARINDGTVRFYKITTIANCDIKMFQKINIIDKVISKQNISVHEVRLLAKSDEYKKELCNSNIFNKLNINKNFRYKYLKETDKCFVPFQMKEELLGCYTEANRIKQRLYTIGGDFPTGDGEYDACLLCVPQFECTGWHPEIFPVTNYEDFLAGMERFIQESFRVVKLDGLVAVVGWNKVLFGEYAIDMNNAIYQIMNKNGDWQDTAIIPLDKNNIKKYPSCAYRTLSIFRRR